MSSYDLSNVLLPAVLISSAVFSTLTLPFALIKNEPIAVELPYFSGEIPPIFNSEHKDVAIPYIGISIVASVGAGIASVEVNRRWQAYRSAFKEEENLPTTQQILQGNSLQQESLDLPEYRPEVSAINLSSHEIFGSIEPSNVNSSTIKLNNISSESSAPFLDFIQIIDSQSNISENTTYVSNLTENLNFSHEIDDNYAVNNGNKLVYDLCTNERVLALNSLIKIPNQYEICRRKIPDSNKRLLAIKIDSNYYVFLKIEKSQKNAIETIDKLGYELNKTVITRTDKGYVIWLWKPELV